MASGRNSTRQAILDSAVKHFARHGFSGASLREILRDAGANPASAHYHFGSKEAVYKAAIAPYLTRLCEQREQSLNALLAAPPRDPRKRFECLIRAYIEPHIQLCKDAQAHDYVMLLARFITESGSLTEGMYTEFLARVRSRYVQAFADTAPHIPDLVLKRQFSFMVTLMVTSPADTSYQSLTGKSAWPAKPEALIDHIVEFVGAGFADAAERHAGNKATGKSPPVTAIGKRSTTKRSAAT